MKKLIVVVWLILLGSATIYGQIETLIKVGPEFQVNTYTSNEQEVPAVAMNSDGSFVVVWQSDGQDGSNYGIFGQRFDSNGNKTGSEFQVNTYTSTAQVDPSIAADSNGSFTVVWTTAASSYYRIYGQRFDSGGSKVGSEFQVNTSTADHRTHPSIAMNSNGNFVVVWESSLQDGSGLGIFGQRFDSNGNKTGSEFQVNTYTISNQNVPKIAIHSDGSFIVVWTSIEQDGHQGGVFGQRFDSNGNKTGSEFHVNTYTQWSQTLSDIAIDANGNFTVVWSGCYGAYGLSLGQRFDINGNKLGSEFQANTSTSDHRVYPSIAMSANGDFIVVWVSSFQDGSGHGIFGQRFDSNGNRVGSEFQVNTYTNGDQREPSAAMNSNGSSVVVWQSDGQDGNDWGIFGQRFTITETTNTWTVLPDMAAPPAEFRYNCNATLGVNDTIYFLGGRNDQSGFSVIDKVFEYSIPANSWRQVASMITPRFNGNYVLYNNEIYTFSGRHSNNDYAFTTSCEKYNRNSNLWTSIASIPKGRRSFSIAVLNDEIYLMGGHLSSSTYVVVSSVVKYNPSSNIWSTAASMPEPRDGGSEATNNSIELGSKIYFFGGADNDSSVIVYNPSTDSWSKETYMPTYRSQFGLAKVNNKIYLIGGDDRYGNSLNLVHEYDPAEKDWFQKTPMPTPRSNVATAAYNNEIYIVGGAWGEGTGSQLTIANVEKYNPAIDPVSIPLFTEVIVPDTPILSSPSNGATGVSTSPTLSWNSSSGATSYTLQVSRYSNFSSYVYNQNVGNVTSKQITGLSEGVTYYWRVAASNSGGSSEWSSIWSFTTGIVEPSEHLYNLIKIYNFEDNAGLAYLAFSPDNQKLSICYVKGGTIYLSCFDISDKENPTDLWKVSVPRGGSFTHTFSPDGSYILNSYHDSGTLRAYNVSNGNEAHSVGGMSQPTGVVAVGNRAYVITKYGNIGIVDLDNWSLLTNFNPTLNHGHYIVVGPNSDYLFYTGAIGQHNTQPTLTKLQILGSSPYLSEVLIDLPGSLAFGIVEVDDEFVYVSHTNLNTSMLGFSKHRQSDLSNVYTVSLEEGISGYMKITPDNKYLFARGTNVLNIFDVDYGNKVDTLKIKANCPKFTGDGQYLYVGVDVGSDICKLYIYKKGAPVMPPEAPALSSPSNEATGISTSPTLSWNSSSGATSYTLQVSENIIFNSYIFNQDVGNVTSKQITGLSEGVTYYWRVRASNYGGSSEWSSIWSFTAVSELCVAPDWNVNPPDYASTMTMTAQLVVFDTASTDTDDIVGAFVGEECRGVGHPTLFPGTGDYVINLTVYSNTSGETVVFKAWDNSSCRIFDVDTTITFIPDADYGTAFSPVILPVRLQEIKIPLNTGWTWLSVNASNDDMTINNVLDGLTPADGDLIKNQTGFSRYYTGYGWWGDLSEISCKEMYMIKLTSQDSLIFIGVECDITPIPLNEGWTWIGYLPQEAIVIGDALQSLTPSEGDLIKNQTGFSTYYSSTGWWGDLNNMLPFDGYKIKMTSSDILTYPAAAGGGSIALAKNVNTKEALSISQPSWSVNPAAFANTMTMTAQLSINGEISTDAEDLAGVFVGDECRGIGQPAYFPGNGTYVITLTIYSNISGETLSFKAWDKSAGQITDINETYVFQPDAIVGTAPSPFVLTSTATKIEQDLGLPKEFRLYDNYPNPFNPETAIMYQIPKSSFVTIRIYNVMGKVVKTLVNTQKNPGMHSVKWDGTNEFGQPVSSGLYIYSMQAGKFTAVKKMLFVK